MISINRLLKAIIIVIVLFNFVMVVSSAESEGIAEESVGVIKDDADAHNDVNALHKKRIELLKAGKAKEAAEIQKILFEKMHADRISGFKDRMNSPSDGAERSRMHDVNPSKIAEEIRLRREAQFKEIHEKFSDPGKPRDMTDSLDRHKNMIRERVDKLIERVNRAPNAADEDKVALKEKLETYYRLELNIVEDRTEIMADMEKMRQIINPEERREHLSQLQKTRQERLDQRQKERESLNTMRTDIFRLVDALERNKSEL